MLNLLSPLLSPPLAFLRSAYAYFAETDLPSLLFLTLLAHFPASRLDVTGGHSHYRLARWAMRLGFAAFLGFALCGYLTTRPADDAVGHYLALFFRSFIVLFIVQGTAALILPLLAWALSAITRPYRSLRGFLASRRFAPAPVPAPPPQAPAPPAEHPSFQATVAELKRDYEATCDTLRSADLDADELEAALLFARQRYLRRLHDATRTR